MPVRPVDDAAGDPSAASNDDAPAVLANDELLGPGGKVDQDALYRLHESLEGDDAQVAVSFTLSRDRGKRLDRYLVDRVPFMSRTTMQRLIRERAVTVNGRVPKASMKLRIGDTVLVHLPPPPSTDIPAEDIPLAIVYEDADLVVIDKHDDIIVHPARGNRSGTIINGLAWHFRHRSGGELSPVGADDARPGVVHRLDRHTTGVMVAAKTETAHWRLGRQFEERSVEKRYLALVHGAVEPVADEIDLPIGAHPSDKHRYGVRFDAWGKAARTIYRVRECFQARAGREAADAYTLVEIELKTGRTHQIRVHLSHLGWPIAGDDLYGGRFLHAGELDPGLEPGSEDAARVVLRRQALHATLLAFDHPHDDPNEPGHEPDRRRFVVPVHADIRATILALRSGRGSRRVDPPGAELDLDEIVPPA